VLVDLVRRAQDGYVPYYPRTSWVASAERGDPREAWRGGGRGADGEPRAGERDYAPGYARLLARGTDPSVDPALATEAAALRALLDLDRCGLGP
jgi:exodeoxyribonuclease V gamma subunit